MKEQIIERVNAGGVVAPFSVPPGFTEDPVAPPDCRIVGFKSVPDAQSETGHRKLYRYEVRADVRNKLQKKAKRMLEKIQREDAARQRKALRAMFANSNRGPAFFKQF